MATPIATTFSILLIAIRQQLADWPGMGVDISRIRPSTIADTPHTDAPKEILLIPENERRGPTGLGSGRVEIRVHRRLNVVVRTRCGLDPGNEDTQWLTNTSDDPLVASLGHFGLEDAVVDALDLWQPVDMSQNALTFAPIVFEGIDRPIRTVPDRASDYGYSHLRFEVPYIRTITNPFSS